MTINNIFEDSARYTRGILENMISLRLWRHYEYNASLNMLLYQTSEQIKNSFGEKFENVKIEIPNYFIQTGRLHIHLIKNSWDKWDSMSFKISTNENATNLEKEIIDASSVTMQGSYYPPLEFGEKIIEYKNIEKDIGVVGINLKNMENHKHFYLTIEHYRSLFSISMRFVTSYLSLEDKAEIKRIFRLPSDWDWDFYKKIGESKPTDPAPDPNDLPPEPKIDFKIQIIPIDYNENLPISYTNKVDWSLE